MKSKIGDLLFKMYSIRNERLRAKIRGWAIKLEGGELVSETLRRIYKEYFSVEIGKYSHGSCYELINIDPHTTIGRYCSFAKGVRIINHNHPLGFKSTSSLFIHPAFGHSQDWKVKFNPLEIGNDVWIGANAIILPEVSRIGDGAVIGAGAVVNKDVPPYAIILGNPGRLVKYRFSEDTIKRLLEERWWDRDLDDLAGDIAAFQAPLEAAAGGAE